jgi:hypothetical protein
MRNLNAKVGTKKIGLDGKSNRSCELLLAAASVVSFTSKADIVTTQTDVCFVPIADIS